MSVLQFPTKADVREEQLSADEEWEQIERLYKQVQDLLREVGRYGRKEERAQNFLRYRFNVKNYTELTIGDMRQAIPMLQQTVAQCRKFSERMQEISDAFDTDVVGRGAPWTPWIVRKMGKRRMHQAGPKPNWEGLMKVLKDELGVR